MSNEEMPAGDTGGSSGTPVGQELASLPERVRVHALARLIGKSSRQVLDALGRLGETVRSAQSSVPKPLAIQVADELDETKRDATGQGESSQPGAEQAPASEVSDVGAPEVAQADVEPTMGETEEPTEVGDAASEQAAQEAPQQEEAPEERARPTRRSAALTPVFAAPEAVFRSPAAAEPDKQEEAEETSDADSDTDSDEDEGDDESSRRRRRRGRRGRGRGKGGQGEDSGEASDGEQSDEESGTSGKQDKQEKQGKQGKQSKKADAESEDEDAGPAETAEGDDEDGGSRRRRRRRRRKSSSDDGSNDDGDPPNTVTHVRDSRQEASRDEVRSVRGSTRLEAKRQRRRDGRDAGRRRVPILSEAEFLARRESVDRKMVVREAGDQVQIGVLEDDVLVEHFVTSSGSGSLVGNVYLGRVQNVLPSMEAAFVDIGRGRNAVLYAGEVDWDSAGLEGKARKIEQALSTGDSVLVQVTKDPVGHKGARLTTQISLPGRFLVYVPGGGATGISRKLPDTERKRLKDVLKRVVPSDAGVIVRTASEGIAEEELGRDVRRLQAQWEVIKEKSEQKSAKAPQLLYEEPDLLIKVVRDLFTEDFSALVVAGSGAWDTIDAYVQHVAPDLADRLKRHSGKNDVFAEYRIDEQITKALDRKVWLPSGGYLVVDRTEAMTVIDVNTGKFTGSGGNLEETVTRNNLEAAEEVVRQLRLRDIGGIIVIDFIDMVLESNRDLVLRRLTECLGRDRTRHQVAEVTSLGLVQMTRKRVGTGLIEAFSQSCEHCRGRGVVVSTEPVAVQQGGGNGGQQQGSGSGKGRQRGGKGNGGNGGGNGGNGDNGRSGSGSGSSQSDPEARKAVERIAAASATPGSASDTSDTSAEPDTSAKQEEPASEAAVATAAEPEQAPSTGEQPEQETGAAEAEASDDTPPDVAAETTAEEPAAPEPVYGTVYTQPWAAPAEQQASNGQASNEQASDEQEAAAEGLAATGTTGPRRVRRTASRPAGPPENTPV
jgi:ribonuclease E